ncbi:MAG TPA: AAA family ATPase, partial [Deltaproteobacteria bacterium]|nr:AAA family ATPase [Deltaproteobacteria bacterium]
RKPSTSEILDWISYLVQTDVLDSKVVEKLKGAQTLVKHRDDRELLREIQEKGIESATSRKTSNW